MTPETIARMVTAVAEACAEIFGYMRTDAGQRQAVIWLEDQEKFRHDVERVGEWFDTTFGGGKS